MWHDPADGILAAVRVLDAIYSKKPRTLEPLMANLRRFAESDEERAMSPDELACTVVNRERLRLQKQPTTLSRSA